MFINKHVDDDALKSEHMPRVQPYVEAVNDAIRNVEFAKKKIKIGTIAEPSVVNGHINKLRESCEWVLEDILTCSSYSTFVPPGAKTFLDKHLRKGIY